MAHINANPPPCIVTLGHGKLKAIDRAAGRATMEFTNTDAHCHSGHVVQGGFIAGMLDSAMSISVICCSLWQFSPASLEIKVSYLKPATQGINHATGRIVQMGKSVAFLEGELRNENQELIATASSSARLIPFSGIRPAGL